MARIRLTNVELATLQDFADGTVRDGKDCAPDIDYLACRGLLIRRERVAMPLRRLSTRPSALWDLERRNRSEYHSYRISKRGLMALQKYEIVKG